MTDVQISVRPTFADEAGFDARLAAVKAAMNIPSRDVLDNAI